MSRLIALVLVSAVAASGAVENLQARNLTDVRYVVRAYETLPGAPEDALPFGLFRLATPPTISEGGVVVFSGLGSTVSTGSYTGVWVNSPDGFINSILQGQFVSGPVGGGALTYLDQFATNEQGTIAFSGVYLPNQENAASRRGVFIFDGATRQLVAQVGDAPASATDGTTFAFFSELRLSDEDVFTFRASLTGEGPPQSGAARTGIYRFANGQQSVVAQIYGPSGAPTGEPVFQELLNLGLNESSQSLYFGREMPRLTGPGGLWLSGENSPQLLLSSGTPIPNSPLSDTFGNIHSAVLNDRSEVAFTARTTLQTPQGIWKIANGELEKIAVIGDSAPGLTRGVFDRQFSDPVLNDRGDIAFVHGRSRTSDSSLWVRKGSGLELIAKSFDTIPGLSGFVQEIQLLGAFSKLTPAVAMNDFGQVVFLAQLGFGSALLATDRAGELHVVASTEDSIEVFPNFWRKIDSFIPSYVFEPAVDSQYPLPFSINNSGQIVFVARAGGDSALIVSNVVAIPEPAAASLLVVALAFASSRYRRFYDQPSQAA